MSSYLWASIRQVYLSVYTRVQSAENENFAEDLSVFLEFLLQAEEGWHEVSPSLYRDFVKLSKDMLIKNSHADDTVVNENDHLNVILLG